MRVEIDCDELTEFMQRALSQLFGRPEPVTLGVTQTFLSTMLLSYFASAQVRNQKRRLQAVAQEVMIYGERGFITPTSLRATLWDVASITRTEADLGLALEALVEQGAATRALGGRYILTGR
ncbi:MAG: hypothetical protein DRN81_05145 [Thermoproteota archaeon]|nr:MAG: hypothetical protein DRN81_05145 [Candidatus Korarchaeota archaeon]